MMTSAESAIQCGGGMNRAFSAGGLALHEFLGRCPRLGHEAAPLALLRPQTGEGQSGKHCRIDMRVVIGYGFRT